MKTLKALYVSIAFFYHLESYSELFNMKLSPYLYTLNKNNSFKLDPDELKDVEQEITAYLLNKSYNDLITKKTILSFYKMAVTRKIKNEELIQSGAYLNNFTEESNYDQEVERRSKLASLNLNAMQKKIVDLLISGFQYPEIRKKLKLNTSQLTSHVKRIRLQNCVR